MKVDPSTQVSIRFDPVSTATQAVLNAIQEVSYDWSNMQEAHPNVIAAAVLRAAACEVEPIEYEVIDNLQYEMRSPVRDALLAIAAELEGAFNG